jgi:enoyl-CoA hydratase
MNTNHNRFAQGAQGAVMVDYGAYQHLIVDKQEGIARITMNRPEVYNATNGRLHYEIGRIWLDIGDDADVRVAVITGAGQAFSAGGDLDLIESFLGDSAAIARTMKEASDIVYNIINLDKPVISAINGIAVGAGLAVGLMADISIASENARFTDGHIRLGVGAGDHSVIIWPLLCGMARAKRYLLTADFLDAKEAERIGLVSMVVPHDQLMPTAMEFARKLADGPQPAIRWTKRALNQWLRVMGPAFDYSLATEMLSFFGPDVREGLQALRERRPPKFPTGQG